MTLVSDTLWEKQLCARDQWPIHQVISQHRGSTFVHRPLVGPGRFRGHGGAQDEQLNMEQGRYDSSCASWLGAPRSRTTVPPIHTANQSLIREHDVTVMVLHVVRNCANPHPSQLSVSTRCNTEFAARTFRYHEKWLTVSSIPFKIRSGRRRVRQVFHARVMKGHGVPLS